MIADGMPTRLERRRRRRGGGLEAVTDQRLEGGSFARFLDPDRGKPPYSGDHLAVPGPTMPFSVCSDPFSSGHQWMWRMPSAFPPSLGAGIGANHGLFFSVPVGLACEMDPRFEIPFLVHERQRAREKQVESTRWRCDERPEKCLNLGY
jgi:hypothetical protein